MRNLARPFAVLISLGWIAFWAGAIYLMWRPEYEARLDMTDLSAAADITATGMARWLATLVSAAALALALPVFFAAFMPQKGRVVERTEKTEEMERGRHEPEGRRGPVAVRHEEPATAPRIRAEVPEADVPHTGAVPPAVPVERSEPPVVRPVMATADTTHDDELKALRERLDRQEEEMRWLREAVSRHAAVPSDERERVPNGRT